MTAIIPPKDYLDMRTRQLEGAVARREGATCAAILRQISADGYPEFSHALLDRMVQRGMENLIGAVSGTRQ